MRDYACLRPSPDAGRAPPTFSDFLRIGLLSWGCRPAGVGRASSALLAMGSPPIAYCPCSISMWDLQPKLGHEFRKSTAPNRDKRERRAEPGRPNTLQRQSVLGGSGDPVVPFAYASPAPQRPIPLSSLAPILNKVSNVKRQLVVGTIGRNLPGCLGVVRGQWAGAPPAAIRPGFKDALAGGIRSPPEKLRAEDSRIYISLATLPPGPKRRFRDGISASSSHQELGQSI